MIYDCTGPTFDGLENPYTGKPLGAKMSVTKTGRMRFFAPDTYSTSDFYPTAKDAYRAWNRANGVEGLKDGQPIVCAYTGDPLKLVHSEDGWRYEGGFDPHLLRTRAEFLRLATMRGGVATRDAAPETRVDAPARRGQVTAGMRRHVEETKAELGEDSVKAAEAILLKHKGDVEQSGTVSMHVPSRKKGRK